MFKRLCCVAVLSVTTVSWPAWATSATSAAPVGLSAMMAEAVVSHPQVRTRRGELNAALSALEGARWGRYPSVTANVETASGGSTTVIRLEQPLWTGGLITGQIGLAQAKADQAEALLTEAEQKILLDVSTAYLEILRLEARRAVAATSEEEHKRLFSTIERRVAAEVSPSTDATQAAVRLNQATNERLLIERQLQTVRHTLSQLIGKEVGPLSSVPDISMSIWTLEGLIRSASSFSPTARRLQAEMRVAQQELEVARAQIKPKLVVGYVNQNSPGTTGDRGGRTYLALQMQTGAGLSSLSAVDAAANRLSAAQDAIEIHERELRQQIQTAWSEIQALQTQLEPTKALVTGSDEIMSSYLRQFQVGRKNWLDVLNAQREKAQASYALTELETPLKLLRLRLLLLAGEVNARKPEIPYERP